MLESFFPDILTFDGLFGSKSNILNPRWLLTPASPRWARRSAHPARASVSPQLGARDPCARTSDRSARAGLLLAGSHVEDDGLKATVLTEHIESDGFQRADEHRDCRHTGPSRANVGRQRRNQKADDQLSHGRGPTTPSQTFYPTLCETIGKSATVRGRTAR
jgi:hypothetical protein